ncbi:unnamed protein product [Brassica napus]|uniref:(rape) hypothetical protein n=1 Tax=Brassica napus TaxID=3708 RepID=A0A816PQ80_BRANA|nr:unnamed protein product [Brassica napus]
MESGASNGSLVSSSFKSANSWINSCLNPVCSCASNSWTALANPALITLEPDFVVGPLRMMGTSVVVTATFTYQNKLSYAINCNCRDLCSGVMCLCVTNRKTSRKL